MLKLVWDTSAIINIKESNAQGYSPGHSLWKDLADGWIKGPYKNIIPAIAPFEMTATVSRMQRRGLKILHDFYIMDENTVLYPIDKDFLRRAEPIIREPGFDLLWGADLIFACIAKLEDAYLVTLDAAFQKHVGGSIKVIDLNSSRERANYHSLFGEGGGSLP